MNTRSRVLGGSGTGITPGGVRARRYLRGACIVFAVSAVSGCGGYGTGGASDGAWVDRRLSRFSYVAEGVGATVIVGTQAARFREGEGFVPIEIAVANTAGEALRLTRESFTLVDIEGGRYKPASPRELLEGYDFLDMDRSALTELPSVVASTFAAHDPYPSKFSPTREVRAAGPFTRRVVLDEVTLPTFGYLVDFIYFPSPASGIKGRRFELILDAAALPEPVIVSFLID